MPTTDQSLFEELRAEVAEILKVPIEELPVRLDDTQTGKVLEVKPATLPVWRFTGRYNLPYFKIGRKPWYWTADVIQFLARHPYSHTGQAA